MDIFRLCCGVLFFLIKSCELKMNRYFLYNYRNDSWKQMRSNGKVPDDLWNPNGQVKIIIHGYTAQLWHRGMDTFESHCVNLLAREYGKYNNSLNIIGVDWRKLGQVPIFLYNVAKDNVMPCAVEITNFLLKLKKSGALKEWKLVHILGYSMGAHVAAAVGYEIENKTSGTKIGRITGLDPAGPLFTNIDGSWPLEMDIVLDYRDAEFVDVIVMGFIRVLFDKSLDLLSLSKRQATAYDDPYFLISKIIHTNEGPAGPIEPFALQPSGRLGSDLQSGHIDFYPNGGVFQKDHCDTYTEVFGYCSHEMSVLFYASALRRPLAYVACPCTGYEAHLQGSCNCSYPGSGRPLGDLTTLPEPELQRMRYYITITYPIKKDDFSA